LIRSEPDLDKDVVQQMIECGRILTKKGLNNITSGNESVVLNHRAENVGGLVMYITRSSSKLGHLDEPTAIVKTSLGEYDGNMVLASSEADIHKEIHRKRFEAKPDLKSSACAHAHTIHAAVLSMEFEETGIKELRIPEKYRSKRIKGSVPVFVSRYGSGAKDMVENMPGVLMDNPIMILGNHGAFAVGGDPEEALKRLIELEAITEKMVLDRIIPQRDREIEEKVPEGWLDKYAVAGALGQMRYGKTNIKPKTIGELMRRLDSSSSDWVEAQRRYLNEIFDEFREIGRDLTDFSMDPYRRGSLSRRIGNTVYITRTGVDFADLKKEDLLAFEMGEGDRIEPGLCESWLHETIYDGIATNYITHLLPEYSSRYSIYCGEAIVPIDVEGRYVIKKIPVADPGDNILTKENVGTLIDALKSNEKVAYVKGLGGFALGFGELYEPLHYLESAESSVKMITLAEKIGIDVRAKQEMFRKW